MRISYIRHSCFVAENDLAMVVFDYWKDNDSGDLHRIIEGRGERQLYFIVSHFHEDHFNAEILDYSDARHIISYDTSKRRHIGADKVAAVLHHGEWYEDELLKVYAMRSTDVGISPLLFFSDGTIIYHAGDNNNWYFSSEEDGKIHCSLQEMEGMFMSTVRDIRKIAPAIDHVMFPIDPRLGDEMLRGAFQWLRHIKTGHFYPMHCWGREEEIENSLSQLEELFPSVVFERPWRKEE